MTIERKPMTGYCQHCGSIELGDGPPTRRRLRQAVMKHMDSPEHLGLLALDFELEADLQLRGLAETEG